MAGGAIADNYTNVQERCVNVNMEVYVQNVLSTKLVQE